MWYRLIQFAFWALNSAFYRRVYYLGKKNIPAEGTAVIFASNHSNGFMDPVLISDYQHRFVYFWVAASEIPGNIVGSIMRALHSIPIYRAKEGKENMHKNEASFRLTKEHLYTGKDAMFIAPEGRCVVQKHLLPLKKGCVRLAFEMLEEKNWQMPVAIVPTGLNYTYHTQMRSDVYIVLGKPILVNNYEAAYLSNREAAIARVTDDLRKGIEAQMIYIEPEDEALTERLLPLQRNSMPRGAWPILSKNTRYFRQEQYLANYIGSLSADEKAALTEQVAAYEAALAQHRAADFGVAGAYPRSMGWVVLGAPFWALGTLVGRLPHEVARRLRNKFVPFPEFSVSFAMTAAFFMWLLWSGIVAGVAAIWLGWWALLLPFLMVALQIYAYHYQDYYREWRANRRYRRLDAATQAALWKQRAALPLVQ